MEPAVSGAGNPEENVHRLASKELVKKQSLELMRTLTEKNNPVQPFITVFGEGEDQMVILNKSIDISEETGRSSLARLMITSTGVIALSDLSLTTQEDYIDGRFGVHTARKRGYVVQANISTHGTDAEKIHGLQIYSELGEQMLQMTLKPDTKTYGHFVPILQMDFQDGEKIQQAIQESYEKARDENQPKIRLLTELNAFARTLGEISATSSSPPASSGLTA